MIDETGIFLNKKNIIVENSPLNLIRNYPFGEDLLPMLSFIKGEENIAPVFTNNAVVYSPSVKPLGQDLFPFRFSKLLSPEYETDTSRISLLSFYMQHLGTDLEKGEDRLIRERGRSLKKTGRGYIDSIFESNSGIKKGGRLLVPYNKLALKGQLERSNDMEPLRRGITLSTETLVNYMIGEKYYISGGGAKSEVLKSQMEEQLKIVRKLESMSIIPAGFTLLTGESGFELVAGVGEAGGMTIAKIFYLTGNEQTERYLSLLKEGTVNPEDVIFFHIFPETSKYFIRRFKRSVE